MHTTVPPCLRFPKNRRFVSSCNGKGPSRSSRAAREWYRPPRAARPFHQAGLSLSGALRALLRPCHFDEGSVSPRPGLVKRNDCQPALTRSGGGRPGRPDTGAAGHTGAREAAGGFSSVWALGLPPGLDSLSWRNPITNRKRSYLKMEFSC